MRVSRLMPAAIAAVLAAAPAAAADVLVSTDTPDRDVVVLERPAAAVAEATTVVYVFPTSPQTFVPMAGLPSFLFMPGAPLPEIATQVHYSVALPAVFMSATVTGDVDCRHFLGEVLAPAPDPYNLDRDGDGIGCEPEDR